MKYDAKQVEVTDQVKSTADSKMFPFLASEFHITREIENMCLQVESQISFANASTLKVNISLNR